MYNIKYLDRDSYRVWDEFCLENDDTWFWHSSGWLNYTLHLRPELKTQQKSFYIVQNKKIIAICPLLINSVIDNGWEIRLISYDKGGSIFPAVKNGLSKREREKFQKFIFSHIDSIVSVNSIDCCLMKQTPLSDNAEKNINNLERFGFLNTTLSTSVIDLSQEIDEIFYGMRKGHRYNINKGKDIYEIDIYDKNNIDRNIFDCYQHLHHKAAGRVTRPQITFDMMFHWVKSGYALLAGIRKNNEYLGFALIITYKSGAYYASACDDPDQDLSIPIGPYLQWSIIERLKIDGYRKYELGLQQFDNQLFDLPSDKDISISFFKRGFGGDIVPVFSGEKYYSEAYFKETMQKRIDEYSRRTF